MLLIQVVGILFIASKFLIALKVDGYRVIVVIKCTLVTRLLLIESKDEISNSILYL